MAEWIGYFIANWPMWAVVITLIIVSIFWFTYYLSSHDVNLPWKKKEWWQDKAKKLEKQAEAKQSKLKAKKG